MDVLKDIELIDLAAYTNNTLIVTDFHIGYEEALNKQGILMPRFQFKEIIGRLESIFSKLKGREIEKIVILGDLKHEFGTISEQEWRHTLKLLDYLGQHCKEVVLLKGNHDTILGPIARKRNVKFQDYYIIEPINKEIIVKNANKGKTTINNESMKNIPILKKIKETIIKNQKNPKNSILCLHGDKIPNKGLLKEAKTIIIGHEHPAVSIKEGPRAELFKCFLIGKWKSKNLVVVPAFNLVTEGTDILKEQVLSPFLKGNIRKFNVVVVADKLYEFGKIGDFD